MILEDQVHVVLITRSPEFTIFWNQSGYTFHVFSVSSDFVNSKGARGLVKTCVRPVDSREEYGICVVAEIPAEEREIEERLGDTLERHFGVAGGGYGWIFPHKTYYSVGMSLLNFKLR